MSLCSLTIKEALSLLDTKKIKSSEIVADCFARIKEVDGDVKAFLTLDEEAAFKAAREIDEVRASDKNAGDKLGPLAGIPIGHKDLFCTHGLRTTAGSKILKDFVPSYDATAVKKLREAGTIILGKLDNDEFAMGASGENSGLGCAHNPWDLNRVTGGSSSGSAAAVAANELIFATGTDTGGSIRLPASFCGVTGWKPSYGRVSRSGIIAMASSMDTVGAIAKTVEDIAIVASITAGHDRFDSTTPDVPVPEYHKKLGINLKDVTVGIPKEYFGEGLDPEVEKVVRAAIDQYKSMGARIRDISLPHTKYGIAAYYIICPSEVSANMARYDGIRYGSKPARADDLFDFYTSARSAGFGDEVKRRVMLGTYTLSSGYYDAYYRKAQKVRTLVANDFRDAFKEVDVIMAPVSPTVAFKHDEKTDDPLGMYLTDVLTVSANLTGITGLSIPCGFSERLPVGLQILAPAFGEEKLFAVGHAYQQVTDWHTKKPELKAKSQGAPAAKSRSKSSTKSRTESRTKSHAKSHTE